KVGRLFYKLTLPLNIKIYLIISITHLILTPKGKDPFNRSTPSPRPIKDSQSGLNNDERSYYKV
ncbi:hypothetical protein QR685DRAFT_418367, partial [Neurospora intermedia]